MKNYKTLLAIFLSVFACAYAYGQEHRLEAGIYFRQSQSVIDADFKDNAEQLNQIVNLLDSLNEDPTIQIRSIEFCGAASPEGSSAINRRLSNARLRALEDYVKARSSQTIPEDIIIRNDHYIPWHSLAEQVKLSDAEYKDEVLSIIALKDVPTALDYQGNEIDGRIPMLKKLQGGAVWQDMFVRYFSTMRNAYMVMVTYVRYPQVTRSALALEERAGFPATHLPSSLSQAEPIAPRHLYLKTNAIAWGMAITNVAVEVDLGKKLSFQLPIYYSGYNYFTSTIKFRTFTIQPELRYWFWGNANDKLFLGAHFGMSYYNFALDGNYRIQDKDGKTPALGGGLSLGYRLPISKNGRWKIEFSVGGGVYRVKYDKFHNTDQTSNGALSHSVNEGAWWGLDHAAVSFSYMFDLKRKQR